MRGEGNRKFGVTLIFESGGLGDPGKVWTTSKSEKSKQNLLE